MLLNVTGFVLLQIILSLSFALNISYLLFCQKVYPKVVFEDNLPDVYGGLLKNGSYRCWHFCSLRCYFRIMV